MWQLEVDLPTPCEPGIYEFTYEADQVNCKALVQQQLARGISREAASRDLESIAKGLMNAAAVSHAAADQCAHYATLIDAVTYVNWKGSSGRKDRLVNNTRQRASRDREWLLYPKDPMPDGPGFSARFMMNRYLHVYGCYRVRPTP